MNDVVIAAAARTPVGAFGGGLSAVPAHFLGQIAIEEAMRRAEVGPEEIDEVIMGQILAAGAGQNPARQAAVNAGIPVERTAYGVNQLAVRGCAPWRWATRRSAPATATWWSRAGTRA